MIQSKLQILVVEDNEGDFILVEERLHELYKGVVIKHETSLKGAINCILENVYDVILLDLSLPDSTGIQSVIEVVNVAKLTPIIVLTGNGDDKFALETLAAGVDDYLFKEEISSSCLSRSINYTIERARISMELKKQQALFKALIEKSTDMKTLITTDGELLYGTPSITTVLGYTSEEMIGKNERDFVHPEDIDVLFKAINEISDKPGDSLRLVVRVKHKNGKYHWCEKTITNLLHDPNVLALVCSFWDMSEKMEYIHEIENQNKRLREIAWIQSHEVRAPIARIQGIVNLLKKQTEFNEQFKLLLEYLDSTTNELDQITKTIVGKSV